jgi:hypothetical protein
VECRCCGKSYNAHNSCLEYKVAVDTKLFLCKDCFVHGCYCGSKHNGGERSIQTAICEILKLDISKKHHWYFVLPKCLPEGCKVPSLGERNKRGWQCWECSPHLYSNENVIGAPADVDGANDQGVPTIETKLVETVMNEKVSSDKKIDIMEASLNQKNTDDTIVTATTATSETNQNVFSDKKIEIIEATPNQQKNTDDTIVTATPETNQKQNVPSNNKIEIMEATPNQKNTDDTIVTATSETKMIATLILPKNRRS